MIRIQDNNAYFLCLEYAEYIQFDYEEWFDLWRKIWFDKNKRLYNNAPLPLYIYTKRENTSDCKRITSKKMIWWENTILGNEKSEWMDNDISIWLNVEKEIRLDDDKTIWLDNICPIKIVISSSNRISLKLKFWLNYEKENCVKTVNGDHNLKQIGVLLKKSFAFPFL